jgi:hypothetical protein
MRLVETFHGLRIYWDLGRLELCEGILETVFMKEMSCEIMRAQKSAEA